MSSLKYARRLIYMACFPLCVLSIIAICLLIVLAITGEWLDITPQLSFLMTVLTAGVVLIAALTLYTQQKQGNEMIKSLQEELKYLTVLWDNILLSASPTRNRDNVGQVSEVTEPLDIMTNPSKIILSFLS